MKNRPRTKKEVSRMPLFVFIKNELGGTEILESDPEYIFLAANNKNQINRHSIKESFERFLEESPVHLEDCF